jgi:sugar/nucleoside kinase (ribokinase family)
MRILGLGNALVDIMTELDNESYLENFGLPRGSMTLVDAVKSELVDNGTIHLKKTIRSGGSAANTIHGIANLGLETGYIGKIGRDEIGQVFLQDIEKSKIKPHLLYSDNLPSGKAVALVSPDTERTFATFLGAAVDLKEDDLLEDVFSEYDIFHIEGYIVQDHRLLEASLKMAKAANMMVSIDMASYNIVEENLDFLKEMVAKYVDIVFANEEEAKAFTGLPPLQALHKISELAEISIVKIGEKGSLAKKGEDIYMIDALPVVSRDTTGAGDLYASGFLYGLAKGLPIDKCGKIASLLASKVIEQIGPKVADVDWPEVRRMVGEIVGN